LSRREIHAVLKRAVPIAQQYRCIGWEGTGRHQYVWVAIAIEIRGLDGAWKQREIGHRGLETAVPVAEQNPDSTSQNVGNSNVEVTVSIEVAERYPIWRNTQRSCEGRPKGSITIAQKYEDLTAPDGEVDVAIAIKVSGCDLGASGIVVVDWRTKVSISVAQQK